MPKNPRSQKKTLPFREGSDSTPTESGLELIGRLSKEQGVDEAETHRKLNAIDADVGAQLPKTAELVSHVVGLLAEQKAYVADQRKQVRHANARENILMASTVLSKKYPPSDVDGVDKKVNVGLEAASNLLSKELSLLDGEY